MEHQTSLLLDYGVNREQSCIMCHLSSESRMCSRDPNFEGNAKQECGWHSLEHDGRRWETWLYLTSKGQPLHALRKFIPEQLRKKYKL